MSYILSNAYWKAWYFFSGLFSEWGEEISIEPREPSSSFGGSPRGTPLLCRSFSEDSNRSDRISSHLDVETPGFHRSYRYRAHSLRSGVAARRFVKQKSKNRSLGFTPFLHIFRCQKIIGAQRTIINIIIRTLRPWSVISMDQLCIAESEIL